MIHQRWTDAELWRIMAEAARREAAKQSWRRWYKQELRKKGV